jgi:hypothetical protein
MGWAMLSLGAWVATAAGLWFLRPGVRPWVAGFGVLTMAIAMLIAGREDVTTSLLLPAVPLFFIVRPAVSGVVDDSFLMLQIFIALGVVVTTWGWMSRLGTSAIRRLLSGRA